MHLRNIYSSLLTMICGIVVTASAETCFESTCHVDKEGTLWCNNQIVSHSGSCRSCDASTCCDCINCDYTVPIDDGDEIVVDDEPFNRCGTEPLPPQYYDGNRGGLSGDGDGDDWGSNSFYNDHSRWDIMESDDYNR